MKKIFSIRIFIFSLFVFTGCIHYESKPNNDLYTNPTSLDHSVHLYYLKKNKPNSPPTIGEYSELINPETKQYIENEILASKVFKGINSTYIDFRTSSNQQNLKCVISEETQNEKLFSLALIIPIPIKSTFKMNWIITNGEGKETNISAQTSIYEFPFIGFLPATIIQRSVQKKDEIIYRVLTQKLISQIQSNSTKDQLFH